MKGIQYRVNDDGERQAVVIASTCTGSYGKTSLMSRWRTRAKTSAESPWPKCARGSWALPPGLRARRYARPPRASASCVEPSRCGAGGNRHLPLTTSSPSWKKVAGEL